MFRSIVGASRCFRAVQHQKTVDFISARNFGSSGLSKPYSYLKCQYNTAPSPNGEQKSQNNEPKTEDTDLDVPSIEDALSLISQLQNDAAKDKKLLEETKDKYTRSLADTENLRRRLTKQVDDAKIYGIQSFCKDLLEVADILDRAVISVPEATLSDPNCPAELKNLHEGVIMTRTVLQKTFRKHGLSRIEPEGQKFDPNLHEALFEIPKTADVKFGRGFVGHVAKVGYLLSDRTIRPAQVGVVKQN